MTTILQPDRAVTRAWHSEKRLVAAGWRDPDGLAHASDAMALINRDFGDRLCGALVGYLRYCADRGRKPSIYLALGVLARLGVPCDRHEVESLIGIETSEAIIDLVVDVIRDSQRRSEDDCRRLTKDALRAIHHSFSCPHCISCAGGFSKKNPIGRTAARKPIYV